MSEADAALPTGLYTDPSETPVNMAPPNRLEAFTNQVQLNEGVQLVKGGINFLMNHSVETQDLLRPNDTTFNPLAPENIKGMERYADTLVSARNSIEFNRLKMEIQNKEAMRAQIDRDGTFWTGLAAGALDPINLIPVPAIKGMSALRGATTLGASNAALSVAAQYAGTKIDPTASMDGWAANALYAGAFGGVLGGYIASRDGRSAAHVLANSYINDMAILDRKLGGVTLEEPRLGPEAATSQVSRGTSATETQPIGETGVPKVGVKEFEVRASSAEGEGLAKIPFGLEWMFSWQTPLNRLISSGFAGLGELAQAIGGDFGMKTKANDRGVASPPSALLRSGRIPAIAIDIDRQFRSLWNEYRGHANGWTMGGLDVTAAGTMVADRARSLRNAPNPDGYMSFREWKDAVFRARAGDKMPDGIDPRAFDTVRRALPMADGFFTEVGKEAIQTGVIKSQEFVRRQAEGWRTRYQSQFDRQTELMQQSIRSASEDAELHYLQRSTSDMVDRLKMIEFQSLATDEQLGKVIDDMMTKGEQRKANARSTVDTMRAQIATYYETQLGIMAELEQRSQSGRGLTDQQLKYLQDLRKQFGTGEQPNAFRDAVAAANDNLLSGTENQQSLMSKLEGIAAGPALSHAQRSFVDGILNKIMRGDIELRAPKNEPNYLPRMWDIERVRVDEAGPQRLRGIFEEHYREQGLGDAGERAMLSVQAIINHSNQWDVIEALADRPKSIRPSSVNAREFDIANIKVADFINTDISDVMNNYARQTGTAIEYSKQFGGDPFARDKIHDALIQAARESKGRSAEAIIADLEKHRDDLEFLRDAALHRLRSADPLTLTQQTARTAKNWVALTTMGSTVFTAVIESARMIGTRGLSVFGNTFEMLGNMPVLIELTQTQKLLTKEGLDIAAGIENGKYMEGVAIGKQPGSRAAQALEKATGGFNNFAESHFYVLNGLSYLTDVLKTHAMIMSSHYMIDDISKVAAGTATKKVISNLAAYGIDEAIAKRMMDENAFQKSGNLNVANLGGFKDAQLTSIYSTAIAGETRRTIVTPSLGDKSMLQQGFVGRGASRQDAPLLTLPFQFMAWGIAANNKLLLSGLQGRDQNFWAGALGMTAVAYLSNSLKGGGAWANMEMQDRLALSFDQSGVLAQFSDLNGLIEGASAGAYGVRPLLGLNPKWGREADGSELYTLPFGATGSKAFDIYKAFADPYATQNEQFSVIRRSVPLNNLFWLDGTAKAIQRGFVD